VRYKRVLLVMPHYINTFYKTIHFPAGLGYISEALNQANIENKVFDMLLGYSEEDLMKRIAEYKPDLIGVSMMTFGYLYNYNLFKKIKAGFRDIPIALGGPHISSLRHKVMQESAEIDYGIIGEGEDTIVELCQDKLPVSNIKGLLYRENGNIAYTGDRVWIDDLDRISFPRFSNFEFNKYDGGIPLSTSRGCPYACIFCTIYLAIGKKMRMRSAKSVVDEIGYWHNRGYKTFGVADDNFSASFERVSEICKEIKKRGLKGLTFTCGNGLRADRVNLSLLKEMREAGFKYISFGVESANEHILKVIKKGEDIRAIENAIKDACDAGICVTLFFLLGSPGETKEDLQKSVDLSLRYPVYDSRFYNIVPYPGTELFEWIKKNNYFVRDPVEYLNSGSAWVANPIFFTPELSLKERQKLYFKLNRKLKNHTLKVKRSVHMEQVKQKLMQLGLPHWFSWIIARLYYTRLVQVRLFNSNLVHDSRMWFNKAVFVRTRIKS